MTIESLAKSLQSHKARHLANGGKAKRIIYPVALRKRAANFIQNEGLSDFNEIGLRLGVAPKTIGKWILKFSLNPYTYFKYLFTRLPNANSVENVTTMLPYNSVVPPKSKNTFARLILPCLLK